jgi:hypothetical protein
LEEPTKTKYFDSRIMSEVSMERCGDLIYVKIQHLSSVPAEYQIEGYNPY